MTRRVLAVALAVAALAACGGGGGSDDRGDQAAFCAEAAARDGEVSSGDDLSALVDEAPAEIAPDLERLVDAFDRIADQGADDPASGRLATDPQVLSAARRLRAYFEIECGIELTEETVPPVVGDEPVTVGDEPFDPDAPAIDLAPAQESG